MDPRVPDGPVPARGPRVRRPAPVRARRGHRPAPLPDRDGVPPARFSMPTGTSWGTVAEFLLDRTNGAAEVAGRLSRGEVLLGDGTVVTEHTAYRAGEWIYLHRDVADEPEVPGELGVVHRDGHIIVVDKPPFLATMPRGAHVTQTIVVRLRRRPGLEQVSPAHRLDRLTAGLLLLTTDPGVRRDYQELFAQRQVEKVYHAVVHLDPALELPGEVRSRIEKPRGRLQAVQVPGEPNAVTRIELLDRSGALALVRLRPLTGRTHQLRVHLAGLGAPIVGDPLYPAVVDVARGDFSRPLQLLASELAFTDPLSGEPRRFVTGRALTVGPWGAPGADARESGVDLGNPPLVGP
ncbi:pseudouridine synthase [Ornithinimicrobium cavernae]|uniref:pseudouridine synthase n=1 Tax=Ornithinimicrobium cavernae TaxID=2666047 RepID=UPI000D6A0189|nr:pseudouridine synthase [Ornithinimicrobium cavernae]